MPELSHNILIDAFIKVSAIIGLLVLFTFAFYYFVNRYVKGFEFKNIFVCFLITIITDVFISTSFVVYGIIRFFFLQPLFYSTNITFPFYLIIIPLYLIFITTFSFLLTGKWLPLDNITVENKSTALKGALIYLGITILLPFIIAVLMGYYPMIDNYLAVHR